LMLLVAALGVERSRSHLRIEIEMALGILLPAPHERTDAQETEILMNRIVERAMEKWRYFDGVIVFKKDVSLKERVRAFQVPFVQGVRQDFPMFGDAPYAFFTKIVGLGISKSGTLTPSENEELLDIVSSA
jgi:hypothetical protein